VKHLFEDLPHNYKATSREAARTHTNTAEQRARVLAAVKESPEGLTRDEIGARLGLGSGSVCPRVWELLRDGVVEEHGTRQTASGKQAAVVRSVAR